MGLWKCSLMPSQETLWYKACQQCNKTIKANVTLEFPCTSCGLKAPGQPRICVGAIVGVYLSDGISTLCATLFSPDAEKLIQYTTADLKASDEKNVSLVNEIEIAMHKNEVLCFLKCLDIIFQGNNERTYHVFKMYMQSEITNGERQNAASLGNSEAGSNSEAAAMKGVGTKEFFSSTTKNVLEEINVGPSEDTPSMQSAVMKRPLIFAPPIGQSCTAGSSKASTKFTSDVQIVCSVTKSVKEPTVVN